jgi:ABC-type sugar transport system, ATPase component
MKSELQIQGVYKRFPGVLALNNVSISAQSGRILGLIGVNGAGKSTLMNVLGGVFPQDEGKILIDGKITDIHNTKDAEKAGIGFIHQEPIIFDALSVRENIFINNLKTNKLGFVDKKGMDNECREYLELLGSRVKPDTRADKISIGDKQMVEIARALSTGGGILLFDEPTSSLSFKERDHFFEVIRKLRDSGRIIIYISHFLDEVEALCDDIVVLRDGGVVLSKTVGNVTRDEILSNMIGGRISLLNDTQRIKSDVILFEAKNIRRGTIIKDVSFKLHKGEVVGVWGLMGSGRTELFRTLLGLDSMDSGDIFVSARDSLKKISPKHLLKYCGYVTENRHEDGLLLPWSVWRNITLPNMKFFHNKGLRFMNVKKEKAASEEYVAKLKVVTPSIETRVEQLSGGNQQKVIMTKWLLRKPAIFFLDEPTRGVDVGAKADIHKMIRELANEGTTVLMVSSEIEEISAVSDRVIVMNKGKLVAEVQRGDISKNKLMSYCV